MRLCTYCGVPAETIDHTIPQCVVRAAGDAGVDLSSLTRIRYVCVHACRECNSALGSRIFPTLAERREAAKSAIRRRYQHELKMPSWSDDELADMGPIAQHDIRLALARRDWALARLPWEGSNEAAEQVAAAYKLRLATVRIQMKKGGEK